MDVRQAAKILAGRRRPVVSRCQHCGKRISGTSRRRYCSAAWALETSAGRILQKDKAAHHRLARIWGR